MPVQVNAVFILLEVVIVIGITIRICKDRFSNVKEVSAKVINKQCYQKQAVYRVVTAQFNKTEYVITFLCGDKKMHFNVSEFSYNCYRINQTGMLKYKGSKIIDFSEKY